MSKSTYIKKKISVFFLLIFAVKMVLSIAPVFVEIDRSTVNAVILQLELENETHETTKDTKSFKKSEVNDLYEMCLLPIEMDVKVKYHIKPRNYVASFFPSVPTPPPNTFC